MREGGGGKAVARRKAASTHTHTAAYTGTYMHRLEVTAEVEEEAHKELHARETVG